eukprot:14378695-Alexandrium_andersonii.AAC.1
MNNFFRRSNLELCGPKDSLKIGRRSSRRLCSAQLFFARIPNLPTKAGPEGARGRAKPPTRGLQSAIRQSAIRAIP